MNLAPGKKDEPDSSQSFLLNALDPPHLLSIGNAIQLLQMINCLDEDESITPIGRAVSKLPMDPRISRAVLLGCLFGCGPALLTATATMGYRDPFLISTSADGNKSDATVVIKETLAKGIPSDQFAVMKAMEQYNHIKQRFNYYKANSYCDENNLSRSTMSFMSDLIDQLSVSMKEVGISMNNNRIIKQNGNASLITAIISMALYPDVGVRNASGSYSTEKGRKTRVHPSSVNFKTSIASKKSKIQDAMTIIGYQVRFYESVNKLIYVNFL